MFNWRSTFDARASCKSSTPCMDSCSGLIAAPQPQMSVQRRTVTAKRAERVGARRRQLSPEQRRGDKRCRRALKVRAAFCAVVSTNRHATQRWVRRSTPAGFCCCSWFGDHGAGTHHFFNASVQSVTTVIGCGFPLGWLIRNRWPSAVTTYWLRARIALTSGDIRVGKSGGAGPTWSIEPSLFFAIMVICQGALH